MSMKNNRGQYEATRFFSKTGATIRGAGSTMELAREDLRAAVNAYRDAMLAGTYLKPVLKKDGSAPTKARPMIAQKLSMQYQKAGK